MDRTYLQGADLSGANLGPRQLSEAEPRWARARVGLVGVSKGYSLLREADLRGADLSRSHPERRPTGERRPKVRMGTTEQPFVTALRATRIASNTAFAPPTKGWGLPTPRYNIS